VIPLPLLRCPIAQSSLSLTPPGSTSATAATSRHRFLPVCCANRPVAQAVRIVAHYCTHAASSGDTVGAMRCPTAHRLVSSTPTTAASPTAATVVAPSSCMLDRQLGPPVSALTYALMQLASVTPPLLLRCPIALTSPSSTSDLVVHLRHLSRHFCVSCCRCILLTHNIFTTAVCYFITNRLRQLLFIICVNLTTDALINKHIDYDYTTTTTTTAVAGDNEVFLSS
jgi:hypothetical protein